MYHHDTTRRAGHRKSLPYQHGEREYRTLHPCLPAGRWGHLDPLGALMKRVLLVIAILAGLPTCVPWVYLPTTPPQMMTVNLPVAPEAAYVKARQAVAAMGGRLLTDDATVRMAFAHVPGPVVLDIAV